MQSSNNESTDPARSPSFSGAAHVSEPVHGAGASDIGLVRKRNEDAYHVAPNLGLGVVADGMGGAPAGELASRLAVSAVVELAQGASAPWNAARGATDADHAARVLQAFVEQGVRAAEAAVSREGARNPHNRGLGSTLTVLAVDPASQRFALGHVGDSRAYRWRDQSLELLSLDHTLAQESVEQGRLPADAVRHHPFGHILTRVDRDGGGRRTSAPDRHGGRGRLYLLCTDGVVKVLEDEEIADALRAPWESLEALATD